jgi:hypothetical protein
MGRTWPNVDAETVTTAGYYWNEHLRKLARLSVGEKLPKHVGRWEFLAHQHEASSSEVARRIFDRYPHLEINDFTYTTTSPLPRRLPMGDPPTHWMAVIAGLLGVGTLFVWMGRRAV